MMSPNDESNGGFYEVATDVDADIAERLQRVAEATGMRDVEEAKEAIVTEMLLRGLAELERGFGITPRDDE